MLEVLLVTYPFHRLHQHQLHIFELRPLKIINLYTTKQHYYDVLSSFSFSFAKFINASTSVLDLLKFSILNAYTVTTLTPNSKHTSKI